MRVRVFTGIAGLPVWWIFWLYTVSIVDNYILVERSTRVYIVVIARLFVIVCFRPFFESGDGVFSGTDARLSLIHI